jgi:hypothetical protein
VTLITQDLEDVPVLLKVQWIERMRGVLGGQRGGDDPYGRESQQVTEEHFE